MENGQEETVTFLYLSLIILLLIAIVLLACLYWKKGMTISGITGFFGLNQHKLAEFRKSTLSASGPAEELEKIIMDKFIEAMDGLFHPESLVIYEHRKHGSKESIDMLRCSGVDDSVFGTGWSNENRNDIRGNLEKYFVFSSRPHLLSSAEIPGTIPSSFPFKPESAIVSGIRTENCAYYILVLRKDGRKGFSDVECVSLDFWSACLEREMLRLKAMKDKTAMSEAIQKAHEEGMVQISSGIIHNIGNALTVLQMQMKSLEHHRQIKELGDFLHKEAIPVIQSHVKDGTLLEFLKNDPNGKVYLEVIGESLKQISALSGDLGESLDKSLKMFTDILEVINLQHQFIGELGTENIVSIETIIRDSVLMSQPVLAENRIKLVKNINSTSKLLVDAALLKHIAMLNIKYAVDSINKASRSEPLISIGSSEEMESGKLWIILEIKDNGYGIDFNPQGEDHRSRDLRFCSERISKYGGIYNVEFNQGYGSVITMKMPGYVS